MTAVVAQRAQSLGRTRARWREMTHSDGRLGGGTKPEATYSKAAAEASETRPTLSSTRAPSVGRHFFTPVSLPPSFPGSLLRHPSAGAVHQGGPRKRVPPGGAERAPGQRREGHHHQEARGEGGGQAAGTQEVLVWRRHVQSQLEELFHHSCYVLSLKKRRHLCRMNVGLLYTKT